MWWNGKNNITHSISLIRETSYKCGSLNTSFLHSNKNFIIMCQQSLWHPSQSRSNQSLIYVIINWFLQQRVFIIVIKDNTITPNMSGKEQTIPRILISTLFNFTLMEWILKQVYVLHCDIADNSESKCLKMYTNFWSKNFCCIMVVHLRKVTTSLMLNYLLVCVKLWLADHNSMTWF